MSERLRLSFSCGDYDRVRPIREGLVRPEGIDLICLALGPEESFFRSLVHHEFDVTELSLGSYTLQRSRGNDSFIALPVFLSRSFRHSGVFVNADAGIRGPEDLRGRRVGVPEYQMTALTWIRGIFQDEYRVHPRDILWRSGGLAQPGRREKVALSLPPDVRIEPIPDDKTLSGMLERGEIDALYTARLPEPFLRGSPKVKRLFPDYRRVETEYFARTRIFPIMHVVAIRRDVYERNRWIAQTLTKALTESKRLAQAVIYDTTAMPSMLPWMHEEVESLRRTMGEDWWPYGLTENRKVLDTFLRYAAEQGLAERLLRAEELFAEETLETFRI